MSKPSARSLALRQAMAILAEHFPHAIVIAPRGKTGVFVRTHGPDYGIDGLLKRGYFQWVGDHPIEVEPGMGDEDEDEEAAGGI